VLGDETLRVTLAGWTEGEPLPAVIVGGAPLLELRAAGAGAVEGRLMSNAAGLEDVVVQTARGCAVRAGALARLDPQLRLLSAPGQPSTLAIRGRPGDRYQVMGATALRPEPEWTLRGANRLASAATKPLAAVVVAGDDGLARVPVPAYLRGRAWVQALVVPRGEPEGPSVAARWTAVTEIEIGP
jgi:hypothetical protein